KAGRPWPDCLFAARCAGMPHCSRCRLRELCWTTFVAGVRELFSRGWCGMDDQDGRSASGRGTASRRGWLQLAMGSVVGIAVPSIGIGRAQDTKTGAAGRDGAQPAPARADLDALRRRLEAARIGPLETVRSAHYEAIGDAPEAFIKLVLEDCE